MRLALVLSGVIICVLAASLTRNTALTSLLPQWRSSYLGDVFQAGGRRARITPSDLVVLPSGFQRGLGEAWQNTTLESVSGLKASVGAALNISEAQFLSFDPRFEELLGKHPKLEVLAERNYSFAHEAPVFLPKSNEVFFVSNRLGNLSSEDQHVELHAIDLATFAVRDIPSTIPMANGAAAYRDDFDDGLAVTAQGRGKLEPGGVAFLKASGEWHWLINNFFGLGFNSPNDVIQDRQGALWFTDPAYGHYQGYRAKPQLQAYVWRYLPGGGPARMMADGFDRPNGLAFSPDFSVLYVADSGSDQGGVNEAKPCTQHFEALDPERPRTIYAYDVLLRGGGPFLTNKRVFALVDFGIPDGVKTDNLGNVWTSTWEGLSVWNPSGALLGKVIVNAVSANFCFVGRDIIILAETRILRLSRT